jgi:hypothetical protein
MVDPKGRTKEEISLSAPRASAHSLETGSVAAEDVEVKAKIIAAEASLKNRIGLSPAKTLADME